MITVWDTTQSGVTANDQIRLPLVSGATYNFTVDWGDGSPIDTITNYGDAAKTHTFLTGAGAGKIVTLTGTFGRFYFNEGGDGDKLTNITQWGSNPWSSMAEAFSGCSNLTISAADTPDLSNATSMDSMFRYSSMNSNINNWDVSTIQDFDYIADADDLLNKRAFSKDYIINCGIVNGKLVVQNKNSIFC